MISLAPAVKVPLQSKIVKYEFLTEDVIFLSCTRPTNFNFKAGQFISIKIFNANGIEPLFRWKSYSICSPPSQQESLDLIIKLIPDGFASDAFKKMKVGDTFELRGPLGHFTFKDTEEIKDHWFLGAGTGVTPLYSMIAEHASHQPTHHFTLVFGVRHEHNLFYTKEIEHLTKTNKNITFIPTLSRDNWPGAKGRVQLHLPKDLSNKDFYMCGLNELIQETKDLLLTAGVEKEHIHFERYD